MVVVNGQPQERTDPFPILVRIELGHLECGSHFVCEVNPALRSRCQWPGRSQFDTPDVASPGWPFLDMRQVVPRCFHAGSDEKLLPD